jgi:hypothetical protein
MKASDWILVCTTLFLGAVALFVPYLAEILKRKWFAPKLRIDFVQAAPACRKTYYGRVHPVFNFRFKVTNDGKSQAKRCEALIEGISKEDATGRFQEYKYTPVNLLWGSSYEEYVDINPTRLFYCDFFAIPHKDFQAQQEKAGAYVDPIDTEPFELGLILNVKVAFFSQPKRLPPGKYRIKIAIYSENSAKKEATFQVSWSGQWKETEEEMFKEVVIELC